MKPMVFSLIIDSFEDLLDHCPQHIHCDLRSNVKSNDTDIREMYTQQCLEKYECEDVIKDF